MFTKRSRHNNAAIRRIKRDGGVNEQDSSGYTALHLISVSKAYNASTSIKKLVKLGATVDLLNNDGVSPLMSATANNLVEVVKTLLRLKADPNFIGESGMTALHICADTGLHKIAGILCRNGANPNALDASGKTPKIIAAEKGDNNMFAILETYADPKFADRTRDGIIYEYAKSPFRIVNDHWATFTDLRDGSIYKVVKLRDGKWWFAENLRFKIKDSWCYADNSENYSKHGLLYTWYAAIKACPNGCYIPSQEDWQKMMDQYHKVDGLSSRKSSYKVLIDGGETRLNALLSGMRWPGDIYIDVINMQSGLSSNYTTSAMYKYLGYVGQYWTSTNAESNSKMANSFNFDLNDQIINSSIHTKTFGFSVRCILSDDLIAEV